jgi:hypothetical protein
MKPHAERVVGLDFLPGPDHFKVSSFERFVPGFFFSFLLWLRAEEPNNKGQRGKKGWEKV